MLSDFSPVPISLCSTSSFAFSICLSSASSLFLFGLGGIKIHSSRGVQLVVCLVLLLPQTTTRAALLRAVTHSKGDFFSYFSFLWVQSLFTPPPHLASCPSWLVVASPLKDFNGGTFEYFLTKHSHGGSGSCLGC